MRRSRIVLSALGAAVVVAAGTAVVAAALSDAPAGTPCDGFEAYEQRYGKIETLGDGERTIAVLGDSYSAGDEASDRGSRWTDRLVALDPQLTLLLDAVPSTGFVNDGQCGADAFGTRIDPLVREATRADGFLVIQGGLNDVHVGPDDVERAAAAVLDAASSAPGVAVIGPLDVPGHDDEDEVDAVLSRLAQERGLTYVSTLGWDLPVGSDGVHLTADGHGEYARRVLDALVDAGLL
ncbi:SGNH/GDSL hydrolase family protein [Microbacterium marinilacus]|uniref:SGNH hydrolase-type esterase domain-containing protein n=1 Tax=Microbacterium marinilacus TaxID=415209 RepID=A0ABP7B7G8_9MICO|nr:SGNH/GDSL hydrolase family protein [Microbacterium marinilacus]MBY0687466.1 SGNH/GDSL hydrolase family protein [Microbacterium marinilacus]